MKQTFLLSLCLFLGLFSSAVAQKTLIEIPFDKFRSSECVSVQNQDGHTFLLFEEKKEFTIVELDNSFQQRQTFVIAKMEAMRSGDWIGSIIDGSVMTLFYSNADKEFFTFTIDCKQHVGTVSDVLVSFSSSEKFMDAYEYKQVFYLLSMPKLSKIIHVYAYDLATKNFQRTEFDFGKLSVSLNMYERFVLSKKDPMGMGLHRVVPDIQYGLGNTCYQDKLYTLDEKIVFTSDLSKNTHIFTLDLATKQPDYKKVTHLVSKEGFSALTNSVLYNNYLFQLVFTTDTLALQICDMKKIQVMQQFFLSRGDSIAFANTPIIQERSLISTDVKDRKSVRELSHTRQLLRKMVNSSGAIAVNSYDATTWVMTVGSYKEVNVEEGNMRMPMGGPSTIPTPSGSVTTSYTAPMYFSYGKSNLKKSAYFKSLLDISSFEHKAGDAQKKSTFEHIQTFQESLHVNNTSKAETLFKQGNSYIFGFYNTVTKKYTLMKFE